MELKAKGLDNKVYYGVEYIDTKDATYLITKHKEYIPIDPNSIGVYTHRRDSVGSRIYTNDSITVNFKNTVLTGKVIYDGGFYIMTDDKSLYMKYIPSKNLKLNHKAERLKVVKR